MIRTLIPSIFALAIGSLVSCVNIDNSSHIAPSSTQAPTQPPNSPELAGNEPLTDIICHSDSQCRQSFNERSWIGTQRRATVDNLLDNSGFDRNQLPDTIKFEELTLKNISSISIEAIWMSGFSHFQHRYAYQLLDTQSQEKITLTQLIEPRKQPLLKQNIKLELYNYFNEPRNQSWMTTLPTEQDKQNWLDKEIDNIVTKYGSLQSEDNTLVLSYCTHDRAQPNAFYGCVNLPAKDYLKPEYQ